MDEERILENERLQIEHIRALEMEELEVEEVDGDFNPSSDDDDLIASSRGDGGAGPSGGFTFDTCLASLHTYLGEVDDTHRRLSFLDGGAILSLPMFYLEGVVLFPEATLPLRVIQPRFITAVEKALNLVDAPHTIGVVRVHRHPDDRRLCFSSVGTTAEIRQYRRLDDGSLNVVTRGQQRFHLRRQWIDVDGAPFGEVQIIQEDDPLRTPKDAFGQLASISDFSKCRAPSGVSPAKQRGYEDAENDSESTSATSIVSDHAAPDMRFCLSATDSPETPSRCERFDESSSGDEEFTPGRGRRLTKSYSEKSSRSGQVSKRGKMGKNEKLGLDSVEGYSPVRRSSDIEKWEGYWVPKEPKCAFRAPMSFWPLWVYQMYDSYSLARRVADMWRQIIGNPSMDEYIKKPDLLSFYIASRLPMSESTRQELLEIDGVSYRLQKEIELLKAFNLLRCKNCLTLIAKRSDMVVMSTDGPLNAFVNKFGYVHEVITVYNSTGLALEGRPEKEHSWFPGYAWTCAYCDFCNSNIGWLFTATRKNLLPKSFWGIRSCQVAVDT